MLDPAGAPAVRALVEGGEEVMALFWVEGGEGEDGVYPVVVAAE
jgi:hypothetical protein